MPQHERVQPMLNDRTLKFHILQMMKMGTVRNTVEEVSRNLFYMMNKFKGQEMVRTVSMLNPDVYLFQQWIILICNGAKL